LHRSLNESTLHCAIQNNDSQRANELIRYRESINEYDDQGFTPLHWAAITGNADIAKSLILAGADIDSKTNNEERFTPLYGAALNGRSSVLRLLVDFGANIDAKTSSGSTSVIAACANGDFDNFKFLVEKGADINTVTDSGTTCLMFSSREGSYKIAELLIDRGVNVNAISNGPLHDAMQYAAFNKEYSILKLLIERGGSYTKSDENAVTCVATAEAAKFTAKYFVENENYPAAISHYRIASEYFKKAALHYDKLTGDILWKRVNRVFAAALLSGLGSGMYTAAGQKTIYFVHFGDSDLDDLKLQLKHQEKLYIAESENCSAQICELAKMQKDN